jgi:hypothetical protein
MIHQNFGNGFLLGTWGASGWAETVVILELMIRTIMSGYRMQGHKFVLADYVQISLQTQVFGACLFDSVKPSQVAFLLSDSRRVLALLHRTPRHPDFISPVSCLHPLPNGGREILATKKCLS